MAGKFCEVLKVCNFSQFGQNRKMFSPEWDKPDFFDEIAKFSSAKVSLYTVLSMYTLRIILNFFFLENFYSFFLPHIHI